MNRIVDQVGTSHDIGRAQPSAARRVAVPILLYHSVNDAPPSGQELYTVSPRAFSDHMRVLADEGARIIGLGDLVTCIRSGLSTPPGAVALTFDDGYVDLLHHTLPVLADRSMTATVFQATGCIGGTFGGATMLAEGDLVRLVDAGLDVGSHSVTHPHLDLLGGSAVRGQLRESKDRLEQILGRPVDSLAYPHGSYRRAVVAAAADVGYSWGAAVKNAYSHLDDDPWALSRITITSRHGTADIRQILRGDALPFGWKRERLRTSAFRGVRWARTRPRS